jgi:hypothetical protein
VRAAPGTLPARCPIQHEAAPVSLAAAGRALADIVARNASIGIRGISKMYEAVITNYGPLPVERCEYITDMLTHESAIIESGLASSRMDGQYPHL